ncbi:glycosyltransferase [Sulfurovum sp. XTW-4]|uniref:Glycosyltransferase n=1 Tax=Sulfurovum xiamenensis TaxID=3019066 RepID=A0ABT7QPP9_9BACT|nr:glycosyltransferase [Sulfurovum xiamenensis]MDM5263072.1 glycosyltransferase [Sulfurovum xiamenensis]
MKRTVTAVIVTYNRLEKLKYTIDNSLQEDLEKIVVVNNNSNDGTKEYLDSFKSERLVVKHLDENIGGAGGFNVGIQLALEQENVDWIVCYDDDSYPKKGAISTFKGQSLDEISAVAAAVYLPNGAISVMNKVRFNPFKNMKIFIDTFLKRKSIYVSEESYKKETNISIDASTFVGFFVKASVVRTIGLPRKELFIYADDLIYTLEMTMQKHKLLFMPNVKFTHDCSTLIDEKDIYDPIWKVYYTYRNRIEMYRISSKWLYLPITFLKIPFWFNKNKFYVNKKLYKKLLFTAILDAFKRDFSKKLSDILMM